MKRLVPLGLILLLLTAASMAGLWQQYQGFLQTPLNIDQAGLLVNVEPGPHIRSGLAKLEKEGCTSLDWRWRPFSRMQQVTYK